MALWTDVIDPATLTGYARASLEEYEQRKGSLASFLPNEQVEDINVRLNVGNGGLVESAHFRAFDAEPEYGAVEAGRRKNFELAAVSQKFALSEYDRLRARNASDEAVLNVVRRTTERAVTAVSDAVELLRGEVIATAQATIDYGRAGVVVDDFERDADMSVTAGTLWSDGAAKPLNDLLSYVQAYGVKNGEAPGTLVLSNRVLGALSQHASLNTQLVNGANRPATLDDVRSLLSSYGIPNIQVRDRKVRRWNRDTRAAETVSVLPDDSIYLLPAAGNTDLGATFWAPTLGASEQGYGIADGDRAGIVAAVYRNDMPPHIAEVWADAVALPALVNPNLAMRAKVL